MKHLTIIKLATVASLAILLSACNESETAKAEPLNLEDDRTKVSYAIGMSAGTSMSRNLESLEGTDLDIDIDILIRAFGEGIKDEAQMEEPALQQVMNDFRGKVNAAMQAKRQAEKEELERKAEENKTLSGEFLEANKAKEGFVTLESGLQYKVIVAGEGKSPAPKDRVKVHYKGTLTDGTQFDSSYDRGQPAQFGVTQVIKGWTEGLQLMKEGSKWALVIPPELAYGPTTRPKIPGNSVLLFEVELLEVIEPQPKITTKAAPKPAVKDAAKPAAKEAAKPASEKK